MNDEDLRQNSLISLRSLLATIRQKRRVWLATGLVGLILGASLHLLIPHKYSAVTTLYLVPPAGADPNVSMANNVSLLQTEAVAKEAVSTGHLPMSPLALLSHYDGLAMSDSIMSIKFSGASQNSAVSGAKAVAQAFLTVQAGELGLQTNGLLRGVQSQISALDTAINNLNTQISSLSSASPTIKIPINSPIWSIGEAPTNHRCPSSRPRNSRLS